MEDKTKKVSDLKKSFFEIDDIKIEAIDLSRFNGPKLFAKTISAEDFQKISKQCTGLREGVDPKDAKDTDYIFDDQFEATILAASICDDEGNLIFDKEDIPMILKKSSALFQVIQDKVTEMNKRVTEEEVAEKVKK